MEQNGRYKVSWQMIATVVFWLVGAMLAYGALDSRIRVLEDRYLRISQDISEIKSDVKMLLQRAER